MILKTSVHWIVTFGKVINIQDKGEKVYIQVDVKVLIITEKGNIIEREYRVSLMVDF